MRDSTIGALFRAQPRFLRSTQLERDFDDRRALDGYVLTPQLSEHIDRIFAGLEPDSGQRAWRITGDYGVGKSSFALLLTHFLSGNNDAIPRSLRNELVHRRERRTLVPLLVTGSRESVARAILRSIAKSLEHLGVRRGKLHDRISALLGDAAGDDEAVISVLVDTAAFVKANEHGSGLLVVLDELGKFLEFAAHNSAAQDVYFLQRLGEIASRSRETPIVVLGLLHQGFGSYAERLADTVQREWQKVAGRFEEVLFDRPLEQTASLVAEALNIRLDDLPEAAASNARDYMRQTVALGWYGAAAESNVAAVAARLYPLHATVLPVLTRLFARFGQNERSLFGFLFSSEPHALQSFASRAIGSATFFRICDLYDYARATFASRLSAQSYRTHWNLLESIVESFSANEAVESELLKTVAMLNLIDDQGILATPAVLELAVAAKKEHRGAVREAIRRLQRLHVLHYRGGSGSFCLWPHTSVSIDRAYAESVKAVSTAGNLTESITKELDIHPLVARRHYIETGNLRHFTVHYRAISELRYEQGAGDADGRIIIPLCETPAEHALAVAYARNAANTSGASLVAVPHPLETLRAMVQEVQRWQYVIDNTPELAHDRYAAEEVSRQLSEARRVLRDRLNTVFGIRGTAARSELRWFRDGSELNIASSRELLSTLSDISDDVYHDAPRVRNELINRRELSSAAAAARMRLIEHLFESPSLDVLGMDITKRPPEMSMYLSVLKAGNLHVRRGDVWIVHEPTSAKDVLNVRPAFAKISETLRLAKGGRVSMKEILETLRPAPLGVRDGLAPLLVAVYALVHYDSLAFYEDGNFLASIAGHHFMRLIKAPATFEIQLCEVTGVRAIVFGQLAALLQPGSKAPATTLLEVVRELCSFAAHLPKFTLGTKRLAEATALTRDAIVGAREPARLVFQDLPRALGFGEFIEDSRRTKRDATAFVAALRVALEELRARYPILLDEIEAAVATLGDGGRPASRDDLALEAERLGARVHEPRLRGFCLRLCDRNLVRDRWLEALGGFVVGRPPALWSDRDPALFRDGLAQLAEVYRRVQTLSFPGPSVQDAYVARLALTLPDGRDAMRVVQMRPDEIVEVEVLEAEVRALLERKPRLGLVAAARALWSALAVPEVPVQESELPPTSGA